MAERAVNEEVAASLATISAKKKKKGIISNNVFSNARRDLVFSPLIGAIQEHIERFLILPVNQIISDQEEALLLESALVRVDLILKFPSSKAFHTISSSNSTFGCLFFEII